MLWGGLIELGKTRLTAMNVAGRKTIVSTAMAFIAELSRLLATAIARESSAMPLVRKLYIYQGQSERCGISLGVT